MSTRSEALKSLVTSLGWEAESDTTSGLVSQLSRMLEVKDGAISVKEPPAYVAKIGKRGYATISEAVAAAKGRVVRLVADIGAFTVPADAALVLDLGGHTVSSTGPCINNHGNLTVRGTGLIESTGSYAIASLSGSSTTVLSGTVRSVEGAIITGKSKGARITVSGGNLSASDNAVIAGNGTRGFGGNTIRITGGTFEGTIKTSGYVACGIYCPTDDAVTVTGGTFLITGGCGICARAGKVDVMGGTFVCTGNATGKVGDSRVVVPCSALVFDEDAKYPQLSDDDRITYYAGDLRSEMDVTAVVGSGDRIRGI